jgi:hypothetical protein
MYATDQAMSVVNRVQTALLRVTCVLPFLYSLAFLGTWCVRQSCQVPRMGYLFMLSLSLCGIYRVCMHGQTHQNRQSRLLYPGSGRAQSQ